MSETRVKVYRTPAEMQADVKAAAAHGWQVESEDTQPDGTRRVTFSPSDWEAAPNARDYQKAMSEALKEDRQRAERDKALGSIVSLIVFVVVVWWLFGQPTLEDLQGMSIGDFFEGWRF